MGGEFLESLTEQFRQMGVTNEQLTTLAIEIASPDVDPRIIELEYPTLFPVQNYVRSKVLLEVGARSMREPFSPRPILSLVSHHFPGQSFATAAFDVPAVNPERTLLEKMFLLHEEFGKSIDKIRHERLSRHLYDIYSLMNTDHGQTAVSNQELFIAIRDHRQMFNPHPHVDYPNVALQSLNFIPPPSVIEQWEKDYTIMRTSMLGTDAPSFERLISAMQEFTDRIRQ